MRQGSQVLERDRVGGQRLSIPLLLLGQQGLMLEKNRDREVRGISRRKQEEGEREDASLCWFFFSFRWKAFVFSACWISEWETEM